MYRSFIFSTPRRSLHRQRLLLAIISASRLTVSAEFLMPQERIEEIRKRAEDGEVVEPAFTVDVTDESGQTIARVEKLLYVRKNRTVGN